MALVIIVNPKTRLAKMVYTGNYKKSERRRLFEFYEKIGFKIRRIG